MSSTVFIDGEAGTTGLGIRERLAGMAGVQVLSIDPARRKDPEARQAMMREADLVVLCLPDAAAKESATLAAGLGSRAPKLLDASTAHRVDPAWEYGFAELAPGQAARIAGAERVANPGCYPTGAVALLRPLVDAGLVPADYPLTVNAVSGYSGGGRGAIEAHEAEGGPAFELCALALEHKHVPELQRYARLARRPIFVPSVAHERQGMLVSVPLHLDLLPGRPSVEALQAALARHYQAGGLVRVAPVEPGGKLDLSALNDTDAMELRVFGHEAHGHAVLVARLDNLGKGASGAAVQNIRLMLGLEAAAGRSWRMLYELDGVRPRIAGDAWVAPDATVIGDVALGAQGTIWFKCLVRGDTNRIRIGARTNVQDGSVLHVNPGEEWVLEIGDDVTIGHACIVHACKLHDRAFVGMGATVLDGAVIESGAMLAAGALLTPGKRIPAGELWGGSPARKMRDIPPADRAELDRIAVHYAALGGTYRRGLKAVP